MVTKRSKTGLLKIVFLSGLLVGTLDMAAACINAYFSFGRGPSSVFKYIASAVYGAATPSGELQDVLFGILVHYLIAFTWTAWFFFVYSRTNLIRQDKYITGIAYGVLIWFAMTFIIVPLTHAPQPKNNFHITQAYLGMGILVLTIGIPLSLIAHNYFTKNNIVKR